jgi:gamma-glutamylcyclotransferase (GGCT)/AIG2-like uncharacterized protein YtfP
MNARLFVYGTLLSTACHPMGVRLRREARLLGEASLPGRLYSLGRYPGLVEAPHIRSLAQSLVYGELYALATPAVTLGWLDAYEGIVPHQSDRSPYARVERPVHLPSGGTVSAWVYVYLRSVRGRPVVSGGRWLLPQV